MKNQLKSCFDLIEEKIGEKSDLNSRDESLALNCRQLYSNTFRILSFAKRYQFKDIEANGFWTFSRLVLLFGNEILNSNHSRESLFAVSIVLLCGVKLSIEFSSNSSSDLFASNPKEFIYLLKEFQSLTPQLNAIYGDFCSFWLCESMRRTMSGFTTLMAVYSCSPNFIQSSRNVWNKETRAQTVAHIAQNASVQFVKSFWGLTENRFLRKTLPKLSGCYPRDIREILIERQNQFIIDSKEAKVLINPIINREEEDVVRCRLLNNNSSECLSVVLHIHGGGFVSQSPDSHETYLRYWSQSLSNASILSVDYSLSPEEKFPKALQQLLDVYLWLRSDSSSKQLGFKVKDIVVCGDSAGGNLSIALSLVIHQIVEVENPKSILSFYAPLMLQTRGSPSRLMTAIDSLLPLGVLLSCLEAYIPNNQQNETQNNETDFEFISNQEIIEIQKEFTENSENSFFNRIFGSNPLNPWYRSDKLETRLKSLNYLSENAFISPLLAKDMPKDIPLYLIGLHFDACLDDSIQMANKWNENGGSVTLDIIDGLPHGFLNFVLLSPEAKRASDLCLDRIKQSLI